MTIFLDILIALAKTLSRGGFVSFGSIEFKDKDS